jgi:tight adherence protein C
MKTFLAQVSAGGLPIGLNSPGLLMVYLAAFAGLLILFGGVGLYVTRDRAVVRMRALSSTAQETAMEAAAFAEQAALQNGAGQANQPSLMRARDCVPQGWMKALIPDDPSERAQVQFQLSSVGITHDRAVEMFFVLRLVLALFVPMTVSVLVVLAHAALLPEGLAARVLGTTQLRLLQIAAVGGAIGFYGPAYWLKNRITERQLRIRNGFPNALDLLQIAVESGLGFDAALAKVGAEIGRVSPEIAYEFHLLKQEVQAGADREKSMFAMADRMGVDEAKSFALVVAQSLQFGTSLTSALRNYAAEMRVNRELNAQEKANKLPVQMSGVMAMLMLPALFLIILTPIIIRYLAMY